MSLKQARERFWMKMFLIVVAGVALAFDGQGSVRAQTAGGTQIVASTLPEAGSTTATVLSQFSIAASRALGASSGTNSANYELRSAGANGVLGDTDDFVYALTATLSAGTNVTFTFPNAPLQPARYRFRTLEGLQESGGASVAVFAREFVLAHPPGGRIESTNNDRLEEGTLLGMTETPAGSRFYTAVGLGSFGSATDVDFWRFDAEAGDRITVRVATDGSAQPQLQLRTAANASVANGSGSAGVSLLQNYSIAAPGSYYLRVEANRYATYALRIDQSRGPQLETEANNGTNSANVAVLRLLAGGYAATLAGSLENGDPADVFSLGHLTAGNSIAVTALYPAASSLSGNNTVLRLLRFGAAQAVAVTENGQLNHVLAADGVYYVAVEAKSGASFRAQYLLEVGVTDRVEPRVTGVSLPGQGEATRAVVQTVTVVFSEEMNPEMMKSAANFELRNAGPDGRFNSADDELYVVNGANYQGGLSARLELPDGPLQPGSYVFRINTGINDRAGNPLGSAFVRTFVVEGEPEYPIEGRNNDSLATATPIGTVTRAADFTFTPVRDFTAGNGPYSIDSGDLNRDGNLDLVVASYHSKSVSVLMGSGNGTFQNAADLEVDGNALYVRLADFNQDQRLDIATANVNGNTLSVLIQNADGSYTKEKVDLTGGPTTLAVGDFNRDGNLDLAAAHNAVLSIIPGTGTGKFAAAQTSNHGLSGPYGIAAGFLDGDNTLDLVVANSSGSRVTMLIGKGDGTFTSAGNVQTSGQPRHVALGDVDGDGDNDLVVLCTGENRIEVFRNDGNGSFGSRKSFEAQGSDAYDLKLADVTGDGIRDVLVAAYGQNRLSLIRGLAGGEFAPVSHFQGRGNPIGLAVGDYNKDGLMDIATANYGGRSATYFQANALKQFANDSSLPELRILSGRGSLLGIEDTDYWSFSATAGETITIALETGVNSSSLYLQLFRPDGQRVDGFYSSGAGNGQLRPFTLPASGTYYVGVSYNNQYFGEYRWKAIISAGPIQHETENNDTVNQGNTLVFLPVDTNKVARVTGFASRDESNSGDFFSLGMVAAGTPISATIRQASSSGFLPALAVVRGTTVLASAESGGALSYVVPPGGDALMHLRLRGADGVKPMGVGAIYLLEIKLGSEATPPRITSVSLPEEGANTSQLITRFRLTFDEELDGRFSNVPSGFEVFGESAYLLTPPGNWPAARSYAASVNGRLVVIESAAENNWLREQFSSDRSLWIGLSDAETEGVLKWENGESAGFAQWGEGEPSNSSDRDFVAMNLWGNWSMVSSGNFPGVVEVPRQDSDGDRIPDAADPYPHDPLNGFELLGAGLDGVFGTSDDRVFRVKSAPYSTGLGVDLLIEDGPLPPGDYRFRVNRSIADKAGNGLAEEFARQFRVNAVETLVLETSPNDNLRQATPLAVPEAKVSDGSLSRTFRMATARNPYSIVAGDFNKDGKIDVATANYSDNVATVLLGGGDGTLSAPRAYSVGRNPIFITSGDFNGDGHLDLATANASAATVSLLFGDGKGFFGSEVAVTVGNSPQWLETGDFDRDGFLDLVAANQSAATLTIVFGGAGPERRTATVSTGNNPRTVVAADFNGDGVLDLVSGNTGENALSFLAGDGKGGFAAPRKVTGVTGISAVRAMDLNRDGKQDCLVMTSSSSTIDVYLGDGSGGFVRSRSYSYGSGQDYDFSLGDLNGDGLTDILIGHYAQNQVAVLFGRADGQFHPVVHFGGAGSPISVAAGDFNGDGLLDLASADYGESMVSIYTGNSAKVLRQDLTLSSFQSATGRGALLTRDDEDYWSFSATTGQMVAIMAEAPGVSSGASLQYRLLRSNGENVATLYTSGNGLGQSNPIRVPVTGTYYVLVSYNSEYTGEYRFRVLLVDAAHAIEDESNNAVSSANSLTLLEVNGERRASVAGVLSAGDPGDFFRLGTVPVGAPLEVRYRMGSAAGFIGKLELYRGSEVVQAGPEGVASLNYTVPTGGEGIYTVKLSGRAGAGTLGLNADYLLELIVRKEQVPPVIQAVSLPGDGAVSLDVIDRFSLTVSEDLDPFFNSMNTAYHRFRNSYYKLTSRSLNWAAAQAEAQALGGNLVTVNDAAENEWLVQTFGSSLWIGLNDVEEEGKFVWLSGEPVTYTNWNSGEPNNVGDEDATQIYPNGTWNDLPVSSSLFGIIEIDARNGQDSDRDGIPDAIDPYPNDSLNAIDLREAGADRIFGTADDRRFVIRPGGYVSGTQVSFDIVDGPLPPGEYRLTITRSIVDLAGNSITTPFVRNFTVGALEPFVLERGLSQTLKNATPLAPAAAAPSGSFRIGKTVPIGRRVSAMAAADFNGDSIPDLAVANYERANVALYFGGGNGELQLPPMELPTGNNPYYVLAIDLNRDGRMDLAVANYHGAGITYYLGMGDGTFGARRNVTTPNNPWMIAAGDLNGDGIPELITANYGGANVSVISGGRNWEASSVQSFAAGSQPRGLSVGDLNGDGFLDAIVACAGEDKLALLTGKGNGELNLPVKFEAGNEPRYVEVDDFDGDGRLDWVTINNGSSSLDVYFGDGKGGVTQRRSMNVAGNDAAQMLLRDLNHDGRKDILLVGYNPSTLTVLISQGRGIFGLPVVYSFSGNPLSAAVADFDRDGIVDILAGNYGQSSITYLHGTRRQQHGVDTQFGATLLSGRGSLLGSGEVDFFSFEGRAGQRVSITTETVPVGNQNGLTYRLYRPGGVEIANASGGPAGYVNMGPVTLAHDGEYFISVAENYSFHGEYRFTVVLADGDAQLETEANQTIPGNTLIYVTGSGVRAGSVLGTAAGGGDIDVYNLGIVEPGSKVVVNAMLPEGAPEFPLSIALVASDGRELLNPVIGQRMIAFDVPTGFDGTLHARVNAVTFAPGLRRSSADRFSLYLEGSGEFVSISDSPALRVRDLTVEGWFNFATASGVQMLISKPYGTRTGNSFAMWFDGYLNGMVGGPEGDVPTLRKQWAPTPGRWYHLAYTFDDTANVHAIYVDGELFVSAAANRSIGYDERPLLIGAEIDNEVLNYFFRGSVDEVRVWGLARTGNEIKATRNLVLSGQEAGLRGYWRFDEGSGSSTADATGNNLPARLVKSPDWIPAADSFSPGSVLGQYRLDVQIQDGTGPVITGSTLPQENAVETRLISRIQVAFNEALDNGFGTMNRSLFTRDGHAYLLTPSGLSWLEARDLAGRLGGYLVVVNDSAENRWLRETFGFAGNFWIGLSDRAQEGFFVWEGGKASQFTAWAPNEPRDFGDEDFVVMNANGMWSDVRLFNNYRAVIEFEGVDSDGDGLPDVIDPVASSKLNYFDLREAGRDGLFDTPDDDVYLLAPGESAGGLAVDLLVLDGPLRPGKYRFSATDALVDISGNTLRTPLVRHFTIAPVPGFISEPARNDSFSEVVPLAGSLGGSNFGHFEVSSFMPTGNNPYFLASADVNGDGLMDLVVPYFGGSAVEVFLGTQQGGFGKHTSITTPSGPVDTELRDVNRDGRLDLMVTAYNAGRVAVYLGAGDGTFSESAIYNTPSAPYRVVSGDFDGDKLVDFAVGNLSGRNVSVFFGDGAGKFAGPTNISTSGGARGLAVGDLNGDGRDDLFVATEGPGQRFVLLGGANRTFEVRGPIALPADARAASLVEMDGKAGLDAVVVTSNSRVLVFSNDGTGIFTESGSLPTGVSDPYDLLVEDVTEDGLRDIVIAAYGNHRVVVIQQNSGLEWAAPLSYTVSGGPLAAIAGDFDRNGRIDLLVSTYGSHNVTLLSGVGARALMEDSSNPGIRVGGGRGTLTSRSDSDYWSFFARAGEAFQVAAQANAAGGTLSATIYSANYEQLDSFSVGAGQVSDSGRRAAAYTGTYFVVINSGGDWQGEYSLRATVLEPSVAMEVEGNNTIATATPLAFRPEGEASRAAAYGYVRVANDLDYFKLGNLAPGTSVYISARLLGGENPLIPIVGVYDSANGYVAEAEGGQAFDSVAEIRISRAGEYYVAVRGAGITSGLMAQYVLDARTVPNGVLSFPNLQVSSITLPAATQVLSGRAVEVKYAVRNSGAIVTPVASWFDRISLSANDIAGDADDITLGTFPHAGALGANAAYENSVSVTIPNGISGEYYVLVATDSNQQVPEFLFEGDNSRMSDGKLSILLPPYPDLIVEELRAAFQETGPIQVTWRTANRGNGATTKPFVERIILRNLGTGLTIGAPIEQSIQQVLNAGDSVARNVSLPRPTSGRYKVTILADAQDDIFEYGANGHVNAEQNAFSTPFSLLLVNRPPTIGQVADQTMPEDGRLSIPLAIDDTETGASSVFVTASSSDPRLFPPALVTISGTGTVRTLVLGPAPNLFGTAVITVTADDGLLTSKMTFRVRVNPVNDAPTISQISAVEMDEDEVFGPVRFTVGDIETEAGELTVTAISSSNPSLIPASNIGFAGTGESRSMFIKPAANAFGQAFITIGVSDGQQSATRGFFVTVRAVNDAPTISAPGDLAIRPGATVPEVTFTVSDIEASASALVVTSLSTNSSLLPETGIEISGTGETRTLTIRPAAGQAGISTVTLTVFDPEGASSSTSFEFLVSDAPLLITSHPASRSINEGARLELEVKALGTGPFRYQWFVHGIARTGETNSIMTIPAVQVVDSGTYYVEVSDSTGTVPSREARVRVMRGILIEAQPLSQTVAAGGTTAFSVKASGAEPLSYQWFHNGSLIPGATSSVLMVPSVQARNAGSYHVEMSNLAEKRQSLAATLTVHDKLRFATEAEDQVVAEGGAISLQPEVLGTGLTYRWYLRGEPLEATGPFYVKQNASRADSGEYRLEVRNATGATFSRSMRVTVVALPSITKQPVAQTVAVGRDTMLSLIASGTEPLDYEWYRNGLLIARTSEPALRLTNASVEDQGDYTVKVSNFGGEALSQPARVTVVEGLRIAKQPSAQTKGVGEPVTLSVEALGAGLSYQWFYRGVSIPNATGATYTIPSAQLSDSGDYSVAVVSAAGAVRSVEAKLNIVAAPAITRQPQSQEGLVGASARLAVGVSGSEPLEYQWTRNGVAIANGTGPVLVLSDLQEADEGDYRAQVRNPAGAVISEAATLQVYRGIQIVAQPVGGRIRAGTQLELTVAAIGSGPLSYQWQRDGFDIPGASSPTFNATLFGKYSVRVTNPAGTVKSEAVAVEVLEPVAFRSQPQPVSAKLGETAVLRAETDGSGLLTYQWQFNGVDIPGATGETLYVRNITGASAGSYRVLVSNELGSEMSSEVQIAVLGPPVIVTGPQSQSVAVGAAVNLSVTAEGVQPLSYQWALNGVAIPGANAATFQINNAQPGNSGFYTVLVSNAGGTERAGATVRVQTPSLALADNRGSAPSSSLATGSFRGSNVGATSEPGEPNHVPDSPATASVWLSWTAPGSGVATFTTVGSSFDTVLAGYNLGAQGQLQQLASNDDGASFKASVIQFNVVQGTTYFIAIDGYKGATGDVIINWLFEQKQPRLPRIVRQPVGFTALAGRNAQFSVEASAADASGLSYQWFHFNNPLAGQTGPMLDLQNVQPANVGRYSVLVSNAGDLSFNVRSEFAELQINLIETQLEGPNVNTGDKPNLSNRPLVPQMIGTRPIRMLQSVARGYTGSQVFSTVGSVTDANEPNHCNVTGGASSWSLYEPPASGSLLVTTDGSSFDTVVAIYRGSGDDFASMVLLGCDNNSGADGQDSRIVVPVTAGQMIFIVVDGVNGASGIVQLNYTLSQPPTITQHPQIAGIQPASAGPQQIQNGARVTLQAAATSTAPVRYQWRRNGRSVSGATSATLVLNGFGSGQAGTYTVTASNFAGQTDSTGLTLEVLAGPAIVTPIQNRTAVLGGSAVFTVAANGTAPLQYEWRFNNSLIAGANGPTLTLNNVQPSQAGTYQARVSNGGGSVTSQATLTVLEPVAITQQPQNRQVPLNQNTTLTVAASGSPALGYQWRFNGVNLPGQNAAQLNLQNLAVQNAGNYSVLVSNSVSTVVSANAQVDVVVPVAIVQQPQSQTISGASSTQFEVIASGTEPISYQWRFNGNPIAGATARVLALNNLTPANAGNYSVVVANAGGSVTSANAALTLAAPPTISQQPQSQSVSVGGNATFAVTAAGSGTLTYQWRFNGVHIAGATGPSLTMNNLTPAQAGAYSVAIGNAVGSIVSAPAELLVNSPINIVQQPASQTVLSGSAVSLSVLATGTGPLVYQWFRNDVAIANATNDTLALESVTAANAGTYRVRVSNPGHTNNSANAVLTVNSVPEIMTQPQPALVANGAPAQFAVTATGTVPMSYQWRFNGVNLSGETNATLQIAAASLAHEGDYSVLVSNPAGALASAPAALAINRGEVAVAARLEGNEVVIRVTGPVGRQVDVEASQNLQTWTAAGTLTLSGGQAESRQPTNSGAFRFYRAQLRP